MNSLETESGAKNERKESQELVKKLSATQIYKDYEKAFSEATGAAFSIKAC